MNKILQKRIEEAAEAIVEDYNHYQFLNDGTKDVYTQSAVLFMLNEMAQFIISNQWISVEEALPQKDEDGSDTSIYVLVTDTTNPFGYIWKAYYDYTIKDWYDAMTCEKLSRFNITHWAMIPTINNEEK